MTGWLMALALTAQAGLPAIDPAVTPSKTLAAPRATAPASDTCDEPVLMVIGVAAAQSGSLAAYLDSPATTAALARLGGYALTSSKALDGLAEGGSSQAVLRFPCRDNAATFWSGNAKLSAASAAIYAQRPLPAELVGKVGDDGYTAPGAR